MKFILSLIISFSIIHFLCNFKTAGSVVLAIIFAVLLQIIIDSGYRARLLCNILEGAGVDLDKIIQYHIENSGDPDCWAYRLKKSAEPGRY